MSEVTSTVGDDGVVVISVAGKFDFSVQREFRDAYKAHADGKNRFRVDLSRTDYLDSSALGMLLLLREHVGGDADRVFITGALPDVDKILRIANFQQLFRL